MKMEKFEDQPFRNAVLESFDVRDKYYNREIHFGHLRYCLKLALVKLISPDEPNTGEDLMRIFKWIGGIGIESGIKESVTQIIDTDPSKRAPLKGKLVKLGHAQGHVDFMFNDIPYEVKTQWGITKAYFKVYPNMIVQLSMYCAALRSKKGILLLYNPVLTGKYREGRGRLILYKLTLTDQEIKKYRKMVIYRSTLLYKALHGIIHWTELPNPFVDNYCVDCQGCDYLSFVLPIKM